MKKERGKKSEGWRRKSKAEGKRHEPKVALLTSSLLHFFFTLFSLKMREKKNLLECELLEPEVNEGRREREGEMGMNRGGRYVSNRMTLQEILSSLTHPIFIPLIFLSDSPLSFTLTHTHISFFHSYTHSYFFL